MCVSSALALFAGTAGYIGTANHPVHGFVHVVGYQNEAVNLHSGPNALILPFPTGEEMGEGNVIDLGQYKTLLTEMVESFRQRYRTLGGAATKGVTNSSYAKVFQHGIYHVVLASSPQLVTAALSQVPEEKRPNIKNELMDWYAWQYPDHAIAVCCFTNTVKAKADPLFWWYKPKNKHPFFPAVDSHSGRLPNLHATVSVDHNIIVGYDEDDGMETVPNRWKKILPESIADFLSPHLRRFAFGGEFINADFFKVNGILKRSLLSDLR